MQNKTTSGEDDVTEYIQLLGAVSQGCTKFGGTKEK
jgi:hypothetical protein